MEKKRHEFGPQQEFEEGQTVRLPVKEGMDQYEKWTIVKIDGDEVTLSKQAFEDFQGNIITAEKFEHSVLIPTKKLILNELRRLAR
jgi:hypothetical protein